MRIAGIMCRSSLAALAALLLVPTIGARSAVAQEDTEAPMAPIADDDEAPSEAGAETPPEESTVSQEEGSSDEPRTGPRGKSKWGVGPRLRYVFLPQGMINMFLDHSTSMSSVGFGLEVVRRKRDFDIVLGLEYENISPKDGLYLEKGDDPGSPLGYPDYVTFDGLAMLGADVNFVWHAELNDRFALRYGAGVGLAVVLGDVLQADAACAPGTSADDLDNKDTSACMMIGPPIASDDVPPVVPIVNVLLGGRMKLNDQVSLNLEGGFHNVFFMGVGADYFF